MFGFTFFFLWLWVITWEEMISFTEQQTDQWHVLPTGGSTSSSSSSSSVLREVQWSQNPEQQNERNTKHFSLCISLKTSSIMYKSKAECFSALVFVAAAKKVSVFNKTELFYEVLHVLLFIRGALRWSDSSANFNNILSISSFFSWVSLNESSLCFSPLSFSLSQFP